MSLIVEKESEGKNITLAYTPTSKVRTYPNSLAFDKAQMAERKRESIRTTFSLT